MSDLFKDADQSELSAKTYLVCVGSQRNAECSGQTEISQLQVSSLVNEQILRLEIAVQDSVGMAVVDPPHELEGELADNVWSHAVWDPCNVVHILFQVEVQEFKDEIQFRFLVDDVV